MAVDDFCLAKHGPDIYLVAAVLEGVGAALQHFDACLSVACRDAARVDKAPHFLEEVRQELRIKLLTGEAPRLLAYAAAGALVEWLRVAALRTALNLKRSDRLVPSEHLPVDALVEVDDATPLKQWYREDVQRAIEAAFQLLSPRDRTLLRLHFVDGLNIERIGAIYGAHRATVARWLVAIRERLFDQARGVLAAQHGLDTRDVKSLYRLLKREVHITLSRVLRK
jgi:RNA polymerase sigma-70 factor (ECF subfamily)